MSRKKTKLTIDGATKEANYKMLNSSDNEPSLVHKMIYLQGCVLATLVDDGDISRKERDYLERICIKLGLRRSDLEDCIETIISLGEEDRKCFVFEVIELLRTKDIKYFFLNDLELIFYLDGDISKGAQLWIDFYINGLSIKQDWRAVVWQHEKNETDDIYCQFSFNRYLFLSKKNDSSAQYIVACCYELGYGVAKDMSLALKWYKKAGNAGIIQAQYCVGHIYSCGVGNISINEDLAVRWLTKASDNQHSLALSELKKLNEVLQIKKEALYQNTEIAHRNYIKESIPFWENACALLPFGGPIFYWVVFFTIFSVAGFFRGLLGIFVWSFIYQGIKLLVQSMFVNRLNELRDENQKYEEEDAKKAFIKYKQNAKKGDATAQFYLADCYEYGKGCNSNIRMAKHWYVESAKQGQTDAIEALRTFDIRNSCNIQSLNN